jgi:L-rhamnose isomerase
MSLLFDFAKEQYAALGVDVELALETLGKTPISIQCWQGDDVRGFDPFAGGLGDGLSVTGNYPGRARNLPELRQDLEKVLEIVPGNHRLNLYSIYGDFGATSVDRDQIAIEHYQSWIDWAKQLGIGMDFNPSCFSHPKAGDGLTLTHPDPAIRAFWIEHCKRSRSIAADIGRQLGAAAVNNIWIPDGMKDQAVNRNGLRERLAHSLNSIFETEFSIDELIDAVECKLFGIGSESMVVGSHEFYLGYTIKNQKALCLDAGHFHPTESIADKISSVLLFVPQLLLHVSRGVRWDSDHVVIVDDATQQIMQELVRSDALGKTHIGLDFFDASINRIAAWATGTRAAQKCLLMALLEPTQILREAEASGNYTERLVLMEQLKTLPWGAVWDEFCNRNDAPLEASLFSEIAAYENTTLSQRT